VVIALPLPMRGAERLPMPTTRVPGKAYARIDCVIVPSWAQTATATSRTKSFAPTAIAETHRKSEAVWDRPIPKQFESTRDPSNSCKLRGVLLRELYKSVLVQGISL
jgi:hypothetical protein